MSHIDGPALVVGMGQLGTAIAEGLRGGGGEVVPFHRGQLSELRVHPRASLVLLAVPEAALADVVLAVPAPLRSAIALVQNELLPGTWRELGLADPTVAVVWFEKKAGRAAIPLLPTVVGGPRRELLVAALRAVGLPAEAAVDARALLASLVAKNLYIRVANLGGLAAGRDGEAPGGAPWPSGVTTMGALLGAHEAFSRALGREVFALDRAGLSPDEAAAVSFEEAWAVVRAATAADPEHGCRGRSAPARLAHAAQLSRARLVEAPIVAALAGTAG